MMTLSYATIKTKKKVMKLLNQYGLQYEDQGSQILTQNCTIDIHQNSIHVNEEIMEDYEEMIDNVLHIERGVTT